MKTILFALILSTSAMAANICEKEARKAGYAQANRSFGMGSEETRCVSGVRLVAGGKDSAVVTYVVGISDEVEPSDMLVVLKTSTCQKLYSAVISNASSEFDYSDDCVKP